MKQAFSLLAAYVFLQVQMWAFAPVYPGNASSLSGTYAGTIVGQTFFDAAGGPVAAGGSPASANGAGVFVIGQPTAGLGTGVFALFASGATYTGSVVAIADPTLLTLDGTMVGTAAFQENEQVVDPLTGTVTNALITITLGIIGVNFQTTITFNQASSNGGTASTRINGSGVANYQGVNQTTGALFPIGSSTLIIDGFLQSSQVSSTINLNTLTNTQGSGGGS